MEPLNKLAIVGVGLLGASIGLGVKARQLARTVVGIGRREEGLRNARRLGAIDEHSIDLEAGVAGADLVVVCSPVESIAVLAVRAAGVVGPAGLVTDVGSTKAGIVADVEAALGNRGRFVGSHPLAGGENRGPEHGRADLLEEKVVVVTPTPRSAAADCSLASEFWQALGARVVVLSPENHDSAVAVTSHLPHLAAAAIAGSTPERYAQLVASGWLDATRIAAGDSELWRQIFLANRDHVLVALGELEAELATYRTALEQADGQALTELLTKAKRIRDALGS